MSKLVKSKAFAESMGFIGGEAATVATSLITVAVMGLFPSVLNAAGNAVSSSIIEPHLDAWEKTISSVCKLKECQPDYTKSRHERAEALGKNVVLFTGAFATSMAAKIGTRRLVNNMVEIHHVNPPTNSWFKKQAYKVMPHAEWKTFLRDEGVHIGSLLVMNTVASGINDEMLAGTTNVLKKMGMKEERAKELGAMAVVWELPNIAGMMAGLHSISQNHGHDWGFNKAGGYAQREQTRQLLLGDGGMAKA